MTIKQKGTKWRKDKIEPQHIHDIIAFLSKQSAKPSHLASWLVKESERLLVWAAPITGPNTCAASWNIIGLQWKNLQHVLYPTFKLGKELPTWNLGKWFSRKLC